MEEYQPDIGKLYESEGVAEHVLTLFDEDFKGICIDVGAYHSRWLSNSYPFEELGWLVWCIEPNPNCKEYLAERPHVSQYAMGSRNEDNVDFYIYKIGHGPNGEAGGTSLLYNEQFDKDFGVMKSIKVDVRTLNWFLENIAKVDHVDYLAIDTEGTELDILEGIDLARWNVQVVAIENLYAKDDIPNYLTTRGYTCAAKGLIFNEIYIKE